MKKDVMNDVWVVVPAFNEESRLGKVLDGLKKITSNVIVVDDGSKDGTTGVAKSKKVKVITLSPNQGKGVALRTGMDAAVKEGAKILVSIDADGQHRPNDVPKLVEKLRNENLDVVFTYRPRDKSMPAYKKFGNWGLNMWMRVLFGPKPKDMLCGFMAYTSDAYKILRWNTKRYGIETEVIARCVKNNLKWSELEIPTIYNEKRSGIRMRDGVKLAFFMAKLRVKV